MNDAINRLTEAFEAFIRALALFLIIVLTFVLRLLTGLLQLATIAVNVLLSLVPALTRAACVGAVVLAVIWSWPALFAAFGGDLLSAIPATVFCVVPIAYMLSSRHGLSGLLAAAAIIFGMGLIYPALPTFARGVVLAGIMGATVTLQLQHIREDNHAEQKRSLLGVGADPAPVVLLRDEEHQPYIDNHAQ